MYSVHSSTALMSAACAGLPDKAKNYRWAGSRRGDGLPAQVCKGAWRSNSGHCNYETCWRGFCGWGKAKPFSISQYFSFFSLSDVEMWWWSSLAGFCVLLLKNPCAQRMLLALILAHHSCSVLSAAVLALRGKHNRVRQGQVSHLFHSRRKTCQVSLLPWHFI